MMQKIKNKIYLFIFIYMQQVLKSYFEVNVYVVLFMRIYIKKRKAVNS